jgi:HlyD family secretion protein
MKTRRRWILWVIIGVVALGVIATVASALRGPSVTVKTAQVEDTGLEQRVSASGAIASRADIDVFSPLASSVEHVWVKNQARVEPGQVIVTLDDDPFKIAKSQAWAAYEGALAQGHSASKTEPTGGDWDAADANIEAAYRAWWLAQKNQERYAEGTLPPQTPPATRDSLAIAEAQTEAAYLAAIASREKLNVASDTGPELSAADASADQALLSYEKAKSDLRRTTVKAPMGGTVFLEAFTGTSLQGPPRELSPGQGVSPQSPLFRIVDPKRMKFVADVDEADVAAVRLAQTAKVTLDAFEGREFLGKVTKVSILSKTTQSGGSAFAVDVIMPIRSGFRIGMNGTADIIVRKRASALQVPIEAVTERDGKDVVFVLENGVAKMREVTLGFSTDTVYEVKEGISSGDEVITSNLDAVKDGMRVKVEQ